FLRTDVGVEIPVNLTYLARLDHATTLSRNGVSVETVEHLLSALHALGVDDAVVEVDGPEVPIMDGSAAPFVILIHEAGLRPLRAAAPPHQKAPPAGRGPPRPHAHPPPPRRCLSGELHDRLRPSPGALPGQKLPHHGRDLRGVDRPGAHLRLPARGRDPAAQR